MDRRKFLKIMGAAGVMGALPLKFSLKGVGLSQAWAVANSPALTKFIQMLPTLPILPQASGEPVIQMPTRDLLIRILLTTKRSPYPLIIRVAISRVYPKPPYPAFPAPPCGAIGIPLLPTRCPRPISAA